MSSPVKNPSGKRYHHDPVQSPVSSPSKPSPSKRGRSSLTSSINGLPVESQPSPGHSPVKVSPSQLLHQSHQHESSRTRMDQRSVFMQEPASAQTPAAASSTIVSDSQERLVQAHQQKALEPISGPTLVAAATDSRSHPQSKQRKIIPNLNICHQVALRELRSAHLKSNSTAWQKKAHHHQLKNDFAAAVRCSLIATMDSRQSSSDKKRLLETLLVQLIQSKDLPQALVVCDDFDRQFPLTFSVVPWVRAYCTLKHQEYAQCFEQLTKAVEKLDAFLIDPNASIADLNCALHDQLISWIVEDFLATLVDIEGNNELTLCVLDWVFQLTQRINDHHQALAALRRIEVLCPGSSMLFQGISYWCLEMPEDGVECFINANQNRDTIEGASFDRLIKIALLLKAFGEFDGNEIALNTAVDYCEWAIDKSTTHEEGLMTLRIKYDCCYLLEEYDTALGIMQDLENLEPNDSSPILFQGLCFFKLARPVEGLQAFRRAFEFRENNQIIDENILEACKREMMDVADTEIIQKFNAWSIELILNRAS